MTWIPVVVVIACALAVGFLREHFRVAAVERWARARGFVRLVAFAPKPTSPAVTLAGRLQIRGARLWGIGLEGMVDGSPCTIAEYAASKPGTRTGDEWFTLVCWQTRLPTLADDGEPTAETGKWPHTGVLVREGEAAGLRLPGAMTAATLDLAIKLTPEARQRT